MIVHLRRVGHRPLSPSESSYLRFSLAIALNFSISYGLYLLLLHLMAPTLSYLIAYLVGLISGNILHIRFTHQKSLTMANFGIQTGIQIGVGGIAVTANGWAIQFVDPRLAGLAVSVIIGIFSFSISRLLLR